MSFNPHTDESTSPYSYIAVNFVENFRFIANLFHTISNLKRRYNIIISASFYYLPALSWARVRNKITRDLNKCSHIMFNVRHMMHTRCTRTYEYLSHSSCFIIVLIIRNTISGVHFIYSKIDKKCRVILIAGSMCQQHIFEIFNAFDNNVCHYLIPPHTYKVHTFCVLVSQSWTI